MFEDIHYIGVAFSHYGPNPRVRCCYLNLQNVSALVRRLSHLMQIVVSLCSERKEDFFNNIGHPIGSSVD